MTCMQTLFIVLENHICLTITNDTTTIIETTTRTETTEKRNIDKMWKGFLFYFEGLLLRCHICSSSCLCDWLEFHLLLVCFPSLVSVCGCVAAHLLCLLCWSPGGVLCGSPLRQSPSLIATSPSPSVRDFSDLLFLQPACSLSCFWIFLNCWEVCKARKWTVYSNTHLCHHKPGCSLRVATWW